MNGFIIDLEDFTLPCQEKIAPTLFRVCETSFVEFLNIVVAYYNNIIIFSLRFPDPSSDGQAAGPLGKVGYTIEVDPK